MQFGLYIVVNEAYISMEIRSYLTVHDAYTSMEFGAHTVTYDVTLLMMPILVNDN